MIITIGNYNQKDKMQILKKHIKSHIKCNEIKISLIILSVLYQFSNHIQFQ